MRSRRLLVALALLAALVVGRLVPVPRAAPVPDDGGPVTAGAARVLDVLDGDTVVVTMAGYAGPVRVVGIDTPEIPHPDRPAGCFGDEARAATRAWLLGRVVAVRPALEQRDRYGRLLAGLVPADGPIAGRDLARTLALSGFARELPIAPNTADAPAIARQVRVARERRRGLWAACGFAAAFPGKEPATGG